MFKLTQINSTYKTITRALLLMLLISGLSITLGEIRYVKKGNVGSQEPYTSWSTASDSIMKCIRYSNEGDTIIVGAGTYYERVVLKNNQTFLGVSWDSTIINTATLTAVGDSTWYGAINVGSNCVIRNLRIYAGLGNYFAGISCKKNAVNTTASDLKLYYTSMGISFNDGSFSNSIMWNVDWAVSTWFVSDQYQNNLHLTVKNNVGQVLTGFYRGDSRFSGRVHLQLLNNTVGIRLANGYFYDDLYEAGDFIIKNNFVYPYQNLYQDQRFIALIIMSNGGEFHNNTILNHQPTGSPFYNDEKLLEIYYPGTSIKNNYFGMLREFAHKGGDAATVESDISYNYFREIHKLNYPDVIIPHPETNKEAFPFFYKENYFLDWLYVSSDRSDWDTVYSKYLDVHLQPNSQLIDGGDPEIKDKDGSRSDIGCYGGPGGVQYVYEDRFDHVEIASILIQGDSITVKWLKSLEPEFKRYKLYRMISDTALPTVPMSEEYCIAKLRDTMFVDRITASGLYWYHLITEDTMGHISYPIRVFGTGMVTGIEKQERKKEGIEVKQNYPNPFGAKEKRSKLPYKIDRRARVEIELYDIQGKKVRDISNKEEMPGEYYVEIDSHNLSSGVYLVRVVVTDVETRAFIDSKFEKIMIIK